MTDGREAGVRIARIGAGALAIAAVADVAFEWNRAQTALSNWICDKGLPLPAGSGVCSVAYVSHWFLARLPFYVGIVALAMLLAEAIVIAYRAFASRIPGAVGRVELLRLITLAIALFALAELIACASDTTCSLSASCT